MLYQLIEPGVATLFILSGGKTGYTIVDFLLSTFSKDSLKIKKAKVK